MEDFPLTPAKASAGRLAALAAILNQNHPASAKDLANAQRCLTWGVPNLVPSSTMSHYQILQTPDYVVLVMEAVHDARIIFLSLPQANHGLPWRGPGRRVAQQNFIYEMACQRRELSGGAGAFRMPRWRN